MLAKFSKEVFEQFPEKGDIIIEVHRVPADVTNEKARRYYWLLCRLIRDFLVESGYNNFSVNDVHELNKDKHMSAEFIDYLTMQTYNQASSSTLVEAHEWAPIFEAIKLEWAQRGLSLPDRYDRQEKGTPNSA